MKITGYHTCKNTGNAEEITEPFHSRHIEDDEKEHKFLGSGYYFWDFHLTIAKWYGNTFYRRNYYIFQAEINAKEAVFLDLVGNRKSMVWFQKMYDRLSLDMPEINTWKIGTFVEYLKRRGTEIEGFFPYKIIRVVDYKFAPKEKDTFKFTKQNTSYTNLNPVIIVCLTEINDDLVSDFKLIFEK